MVLLDAGVSMRAPLRERVSSRLHTKSEVELNTRFEAAVSAVEGFIQQKVRVFVVSLYLSGEY